MADFEQKYVILVRCVDLETGDIEVVKSCEGTEKELYEAVQSFYIRSRFHPNEKAVLCLKQYEELAMSILKRKRMQSNSKFYEVIR